MEKIIPENALKHKKKKPGLSANRPFEQPGPEDRLRDKRLLSIFTCEE